MGNPHSFYRFKQAWNAGFYPDNQIVSDLLNEMQGLITGFLPSWAVIGTTTIGQLKQSIKLFVEDYNASPYYGNFTITTTTAPDPPFMDYYIYIRDESLYTMDNTQQLLITGQYNATTKVLTSATLTSFTPGSYTGSFAPTLIAEEEKVKEALNVVYINGSAIFPITYSFDSTTNLATSGLARGGNWLLSGDTSNRLPAPTVPYQNRRTFELSELNGDDTYIISVMERIIQASLADNDYTTSVLATFNSFSAPDGWTFTAVHPSFTTYERVQFNFVNPDRRKFILVGRLDSNWLWQRFVSDYYNNAPYNFLTNYSEVTPLPYEPNQAGRWLYNDDTLDFEFTEFTSGCYVSPEFYAMPAKPGDQFQFNIADGNLTGLESVNVGLFTEDGQFVQKVGEAIKANTFIGLGMWGIAARGTYDDWYISYYNASDPIQFIFTDCDGNPIGDAIATINYLPDGQFSTFKSIVEALSFPEGISVIVTQDNTGRVIFKFTIDGDFDCNCGITAFTYYEGSGETVYFIKPTMYQNIGQASQFYASCTIPSVRNGCYRLGTYNEPTTTCDMTFFYSLSYEALDDYLSAVNATYGGLNPYLSWIVVPGDEYVYEVVSNSTTAQDIAAWCNANIPGMNAVGSEVYLDITWTRNNLPCGEVYGMSNCISDISADTCLVQLWTTGDEPCVCGTSYDLYSLSNIINIDASDCFSTMIEYWSDNNTINSGFEYFNDWKQRIRLGLNGGGEKPMIEESLYRQSNGVHRRPQSKQDLSVDLHSDFLDLDTQLALVDATRHPYLVWEGKSIFVKGDIEVATTQDFTTQSSFETLSQVKFQALIQGFQPKNSSCLTC